MTTPRRRSLVASLIAGLASLFGCARPDAPSTAPGRVARELRVVGFDAEGEPVVQVLDDGAIRIRFEAMPPFFAEDRGTEADFAEFDGAIAKAIGLPVLREDREDFVVRDAPAGTAERIVEWLSAFHDEKP